MLNTGDDMPTPIVSFRLSPDHHDLFKRLAARLKVTAGFADQLEALLAGAEAAEVAAKAAAEAEALAAAEAEARRPDLADRVGQLEGVVGRLESAVQHLTGVVEALATPKPGRKGGGGSGGGKAKGEPRATTPATTDPTEAPAEAPVTAEPVAVPDAPAAETSPSVAPLDVAARDAEMAALKAAGMSSEDIGQRFGMSFQNVNKRIARHRKAVGTDGTGSGAGGSVRTRPEQWSAAAG